MGRDGVLELFIIITVKCSVSQQAYMAYSTGYCASNRARCINLWPCNTQTTFHSVPKLESDRESNEAQCELQCSITVVLVHLCW